jgi:glycosyltransferase involved in cell wall biosynthesis
MNFSHPHPVRFSHIAPEALRLPSGCKRMRIICYSSGAWPCGIANYQHHLEPSLHQSFAVTTRLLPTAPVLRDRPVALAKQRALYAKLAAESASYDVALLQFVTFWNGNRLGENMLPAFVGHLAAPTIVVLHEWPIPQAPESDDGSWPRRVVRSAALKLAPGPRDYDAWLRTTFFAQMAHFIVHSSELSERLGEVGVSRDRITQIVHPVYELESTLDGDPLTPALVQKLEDKRMLLLFGFPHPRKNYELALRALKLLPDDVVLVMAGSTEGQFRSDYVRTLFRLARDLGVADRFHATGEIGSRALSDLFGRTAVAVAPFSYATGSGSIGYFLGAQLPVVASDLRSNVEVLRSGGGLHLFKQDDSDDLAGRIADILSSPSMRQRLCEQSRRFAALHNFRRLGDLIGQRLRARARVEVAAG